MLRVGGHVSVAGGVDNAVERQVAVGGNCGQIFTHSPQVWRDPDVGDREAEQFRAASADADVGPWVLHSSYLVNLATPKAALREKSVASLQAELRAAAKLGVPYVNVHLGAHTGAGVARGLENAASALDELDVPDGVTVLVESDAGSGTKLGGEFAHLGRVLALSDQALGVCLDTAHSFAAGYDLTTPAAVDETLAALDDAVGTERVRCVHLNDSKHARGTNRDEHAHVGEGEIGADGLRAVVTHPALRDVPFVLETPTEGGKGFAENVERVQAFRADD
ncbi:MAG: deoxyribonuclease IV [Halobacteriaceae archaeon]